MLILLNIDFTKLYSTVKYRNLTALIGSKEYFFIIESFPICNLLHFFSFCRPPVRLGTALDRQILPFPSRFWLNDIQTMTVSFRSFQCRFKSSKNGMTVERYWNDKLCRSLMSPNITGGPVARLSDSGHLGWNDSGMTIGTTFEQKLKRLR